MTDKHVTPRYELAQSATFDGLWAVIDASAGWPVVVRGIPLDALSGYEATDLVDLMNERNLRAREILSPGPK